MSVFFELLIVIPPDEALDRSTLDGKSRYNDPLYLKAELQK